jgi:hypothetical protein
MQYKVPQNVDIEDKVFGPLTIRQFLIMLVPIGLLVVLYYVFSGPLRIIFFLLAFLLLTTAGAIAFGNYGGQHFEVFLLGALKTLRTPRTRIWKKEEAVADEGATPQAATAEPKNPAKKSIEDTRSDLERLAQVVDSGSSPSPGADGVDDILERAEAPNSNIDPLLEITTQKPAPKEPLISDIASVSPNQSFDYPKVEVKKQKISKY